MGDSPGPWAAPPHHGPMVYTRLGPSLCDSAVLGADQARLGSAYGLLYALPHVHVEHVWAVAHLGHGQGRLVWTMGYGLVYGLWSSLWAMV